MKTNTCSVLDCPDTHPDIICQLCDWWYPYGGAVCRHMFERWMKEEQEVRDLHKAYIDQKQAKNIVFLHRNKEKESNYGD